MLSTAKFLLYQFACIQNFHWRLSRMSVTYNRFSAKSEALVPKFFFWGSLSWWISKFLNHLNSFHWMSTIHKLIQLHLTTKWITYLYLYMYQLSPRGSGWTGFLPSKYSNIAISVAHWGRYFGIWLREGSQVLPRKMHYLPQIFHKRIDGATWGRQLTEQTPPGILHEPL